MSLCINFTIIWSSIFKELYFSFLQALSFFSLWFVHRTLMPHAPECLITEVDAELSCLPQLTEVHCRLTYARLQQDNRPSFVCISKQHKKKVYHFSSSPFLWASVITLIIKQLLPYGPEITTETLWSVKIIHCDPEKIHVLTGTMSCNSHFQGSKEYFHRLFLSRKLSRISLHIRVTHIRSCSTIPGSVMLGFLGSYLPWLSMV